MDNENLIYVNTAKFFDKLATNWDNISEALPKKLESLIEYCDINPDDKVLDIACGTGIIDGIILDKTNKEIVGIDLSNEMINRAKEKYIGLNIRFQNTNFYYFDEKGFDKAIIFNAYPHFLDKEKLAKKLNAILKKNGTFVIMHDESADKINCRHLGTKEVERVSVPLQSATLEAQYFVPYFDIIRIIDNEDMFFIMGKKK